MGSCFLTNQPKCSHISMRWCVGELHKQLLECLKEISKVVHSSFHTFFSTQVGRVTIAAALATSSRFSRGTLRRSQAHLEMQFLVGHAMRKIVKIVKCCETFTYVYFLLIRQKMNIEQSFGYRHRLTANLPDFPHKFRHEERAKKVVVDICFFFLCLFFSFFFLSSSRRVKLKTTAAACFSLMAFPHFKLG